MPSSQDVIRARDLIIGYGRKAISSGISFELQPNEILCLLGPNGSGKSTLFKTLMGLIPPQGGDLRILDKAVRRWPRREFARQVGYVPQAHDGVFPFTVEEIVLMGRTARIGRYSAPGQQDREIAGRCLQGLNILHLRERPYNEISGGERQLALIARAMAQEPTVLIMDEPTASLDFGNQIRVLEHIRQLKNQGMAILLCTHQPEHALKVADRVALFRDGVIHYCGQTLQTMTRERLAWLYDLDPEQIPAMAGPDH